jgi:capsular polysaccharide biosynthesis protein
MRPSLGTGRGPGSGLYAAQVRTDTGRDWPGLIRRLWRRRTDVLIGVTVAVLVLLAGAGLWLLRPTQYQASTALVVLPAEQSNESAGFYDTLSRGQVVQTFAQILDLQGGQQSAYRSAGVAVVVEVVPETSLIEVRATASDGAAAESAADSVLTRSRTYFSQLSSPYSISVVREADGTAQQVGLPLGPLAGVVAAVAVLAGLASFLATRALLSAGRPLTAWMAPRPGLNGAAARQDDADPARAPRRDVAGSPRTRSLTPEPLSTQGGT